MAGALQKLCEADQTAPKLLLPPQTFGDFGERLTKGGGESKGMEQNNARKYCQRKRGLSSPIFKRR